MKKLFYHLQFLAFTIVFLFAMAANGQNNLPFVLPKLLEPKTLIIVLKTANGALRKKVEGNVKKPFNKYYKGSNRYGATA